ncbi:MAG: leucine-rich repeat protein [Verrucomicrobiota bacterium]
MTIPNSVANIGDEALMFCYGLTNVIIGGGVANLGQYAFSYCMSLDKTYFQGSAPTVDGVIGSTDATAFQGESGSAYYLPGTAGWGATCGSWPTAVWYQSQPQILGSDHGLGVRSGRFQSTISWAINASVVIDASTNLQTWTPLITNTLVNGTNVFIDAK